jgi:ABC-type sugar transport system ATPase subunit/ribose/xylose/arabinose/galactoside ABC-type transport system permease subunit
MQNDSLIRIENISKSFYGVKALKDVSFNIFKGEIVGLVGANGSGKSTLLKIIGGIYKSEEGKIRFEDSELVNINPYIAQTKGIISVYQELNLFTYLSVAENLFIGKEIKTKAGTINWKATRRKAAEILSAQGLDISPDAIVSSLSVAQQLLVELARVFNEKPKLLLLDEPTASLSETEIQWLFFKVRELVKNGTTVIYVSHRLEEVAKLCDRCVILRDGALAKELDSDFDIQTIVRYMIGHNVEIERKASEKIKNNDVVFECRNINFKNKLRDVSFSLNKGEILGIAGLVGAGRTELLRAIFGVDRMTSGTILKDGKAIKIRHPKNAVGHGIVMIPEDRKLEGLFLNENVRFNISASTLEKRTKAGFIDTAAESKSVNKAAKDVMLDTGRMEHLVKLLSGGNQQKAVIAKTLLVNADVLLLDEPTRGVDIGAREEIYEIIKTLAENGKSIILVSSDWEELIMYCDRVLVMAEGKMTGELDGKDITEEKIMHLSTIAHISKKEDKPHKNGAAMAGPNKFFIKKDDRPPKRDDVSHSINPAIPKLNSIFGKNNTAILSLLLLFLIILSLILSPSFRTWINTRNVMSQTIPFLLLTLGQLIVIIAGCLDMSIGALLASTSVLGVTLMLKFPDNIMIGVIAMVGLALLVGTLNGLLVVKAKVDSFVATLGMAIVLEGVALVITPKPIAPAPKILRTIANKGIGEVPNVLIIIVVAIVVFAILLKYIPFGRRLFAVGENSTGSYWAGLPVQSTKFIAYIICSLMAVLAALYMLGRTGAGDPVFGPGLELDAIAIALIGGATLAGGRGSLAGTVIGVFVMSILYNILSLMEVSLWYQDVLRGVILLAIIMSYERRIRRAG